MAVQAHDVHRLFLQAVLSRRVVSASLAKVLWKKSVEAVNAAGELELRHAPDDWDKFVKKINENLNPLDLEFRHHYDEITGTEVYAIINRRGDDVAKIATDYSPLEIAYFKGVVEQIMLAPHESYSISSMLALREVNTLKSSMSKSQAEVVLASFVAKGWLLKSKRGRYSLSTRTLLELQAYLKGAYPDDIIECTICMEMVTRGWACFTRQCKARLHNHCYTNYRRRNGKCPACAQDWTGEANERKLQRVGEDAVKDGMESRVIRNPTGTQGDAGDDDDAGPARSQKKKSTKQKKSKHVADDMDVDEDEDEDEEDEEADYDEADAEPTQATQKARGKARATRSDSDAEPVRTQRRSSRR